MLGGQPIEQKVNGHDLKAVRTPLACKRETEGAPLCRDHHEAFDIPVYSVRDAWPHGAKCAVCRRMLVPAPSRSPIDI
ncbi:MAG TPA: hypothetical protein VNN77_10265 [candidate division Zixibacteria bacterium]|nr:hypothetical protein [candidate division Zixibacteria bacterium]